MRTNQFVVIVSVTLLTIGLFAWINQPQHEPPLPSHIQGFAFSPFQSDDDPVKSELPSVGDILKDLSLVSRKTDAIRTYSNEGSLEEVARLAAPLDLSVAQGIWLDWRKENNEVEIAKVIASAKENPNVTRIIVGNEVLLRNDMSPAELIEYIERVRAEVDVPLGIAEPWHIFLAHPEVVEHLDFMGIHLLPYWEGVDIEEAIPYVMSRYGEVGAAYPDVPIVIAEVGWPSEGRTREAAVASKANQAVFLRRFLTVAEEQGLEYFVMEAFDQPWKQDVEGAVGAYWGVWDDQRKAKFEFSAPIVGVPLWPLLSAITVILAALIVFVFLRYSRTLNTRGSSFMALVVYAAATIVVWVIYDYTQRYLTLSNIIVGMLLVVGMIGVLLVLLAEAHEWAEAHWVRERRREFQPLRVPDERLPRVSVQIPTYNEPPEMVMQTLDALARLDYPDFEVIVLDNNTRDPAVWEPVRDHCARLGERFRFFHFAPLAGFKAGALNKALELTDPTAEIVAVIDSDYMVEPGWLRDLVPQFENPQIAIVQAPQDYRDERESLFKAMCDAEYAGFFQIGMVTRNERNAIIQHGTMTMVRRSVLVEVGGWAEWCITEDAELGLRVFAAGYEATYIATGYGRGLIPDNFTDFKKQRFRWAYGAIQILRRHADILFGAKSSKLNVGQSYHFLAGWLPWITDGLNLFFTAAAIVWSLNMILWPMAFDPPLLELAMLPLGLFVFKLAKLIYLYQTRVQASLSQTLAAAAAGLALSHTIAKAVVNGFITSDKPFFRTPKMASSHAWLKAVADSWQELLLMVVLWSCAAGVALRAPVESPDLLVWLIVLLIQGMPYALTVVVSLVSALPGLSARWVKPRRALTAAPV